MKGLLTKLAYWLLKLATKKTVFYVKYESDVEIKHYGRGSGRTTRIIDKLIQRFFEEGETHVYDHYDTRQSNERVMQIMLERLEREHNITRDMLDINRGRLFIKLKK